MTSYLICLALAALTAVCLMPLAMRYRAGHNQVPGVQDLHLRPTSRLGGAIVFVGYCVGVGAAVMMRVAPLRAVVVLILCGMFVFGAGIWEDITRRLPPKHRLLAAILSGLLACIFAGGIAMRLDIPYVDQWMLVYPALAIALTCFMVAGSCNAFNIIDGSNGLVGGTALVMFGGMAIMGAHVGDNLVLIQSLAIIGALVGFMCWNFPRGRIFLGDGGAYFVGFLYAELAIQLAARSSHVSAWFVIMLAAYPIVETLASMYRRIVVTKTPSTEPDSLHLHSLVFRKLTLPAERRQAKSSVERANARVAPWIWLHALACLVYAVAFHDNSTALLIGIVVYGAIYTIHYRMLWKIRPDDRDYDIDTMKSGVMASDLD